MLDTCTIDLPLAGQVYDPATDFYITPSTELYFGRCRVKAVDNADQVVDAGAEVVSLWPFEVLVPMSVVGLVRDAVVTVRTSALDPELVGLRLRIRAVGQGTFVTARRLGCEVQA